MLSRRQFVLAACALAVTAARPVAEDKFTIAVVSDTQNYVDVTLAQPRGFDTFAQQMQYLVDKREEKNLVFATFVGDIVQHGDGQFRENVEGSAENQRVWDTRGEWDNANRAVSILSRSSIPFGMVPGNHDYDNYSWWNGPDSPGASRPLINGRVWELYFGPRSKHFADKPWYGGSFHQGMNSYQFFVGGGRRFLHFSFEMEPTPAVLNWAQGVIDANPGVPVMFTTHEWLKPALEDTIKRANDHETYFKGTDHLTPDEVWNRFVRRNPAIFLVICGHLWTPTSGGISQGENLRIDKNDAGFPVYQVLSDYQGNTVGRDGKAGSANGGAGWLRFIEFDTNTRKMHFYTYSTLLNRYAGRNGENPFNAPAKYSDFELDFPPQLLK